MTLHPQAEHEALKEARTLLQDEDGRALYAKRSGVEAIFSQGVCTFGMRRSRYRGLRKTHLQQVATAAALDLVRLSQWMAGRRPEGTHRSAFERLAA